MSNTKTIDTTTIGGRIKQLRKERGVTQGDVATALCVKRQTVDQWENSKTRDFNANYAVAVANYFGVSCDEILRGVKPEHVTTSLELGLSDAAIEKLTSFRIHTITKHSYGGFSDSYTKIPSPIEISELIEQDDFADLLNCLKSIKLVCEDRIISEAGLQLLKLFGKYELWDFYQYLASKFLYKIFSDIAPRPVEE